MKRLVEVTSIVLLVFMFVAMLHAGQAWAVSSVGGWSKTYGGTDNDEAYALVQTSDGGYALAGQTASLGALVKTDASGNIQWNKTYGETSCASALVQTSDGGYALAGWTNSFGAGEEDFWLVKTDASGNMLWNKTYGGSNGDFAHALVQTSDGGYALAGDTNSFGVGQYDFYLVKTDASGNMLWNKTYGGSKIDTASALVQTSDGGYALAGWTNSFGAGQSDIWFLKVDSSGNMQWNKTYGGASVDEATALVKTHDGGYALAGVTDSFGTGGGDFWLVKTDASGNMLWNETYGGTNFGASALVQTSDGGYALAGSINSFGVGQDDFWLVKTDASGNMLWNQTYGGPEDDLAYALVQTSDGGYAVAGYTGSFGAGGYDFWLVKTDASGVVPEFPSALILAVLVAVTSLTVLMAKRKSEWTHAKNE